MIAAIVNVLFEVNKIFNKDKAPSPSKKNFPVFTYKKTAKTNAAKYDIPLEADEPSSPIAETL